MKPVLMIHDICKGIFDLPLEDYVLTFDDGLMSQWHWLPMFLRIPTDKIFFISTKYLCTGRQVYDFPLSPVAHEKARAGNLEDFMTAPQVYEIINSPRCFIGGHSHAHVNLNNIPRMTDRIRHIKQDTDIMMESFKTLFGITPTKFCFPYNNDLNGLYTGLLKPYGFTEFYGRERISVESLLRN